MNIKNERIKKLYLRGLSIDQIAKKLGLADTDRVKQGLDWLVKRGEIQVKSNG